MIVRREILRSEAAEGEGSTSTAAPAKPQTREGREVARQTTVVEKRAKTAGEVKAFLESEGAKRAAAKSADADAPAQASQAAAIEAAPTAKAEATAEAIADAGGKVSAQRAGESDQKYEARLVDALQKLRASEENTKRERSRAEASETRAAGLEKAVADFEKKLARGKDPEAALEFMLDTTGLTLEDIVKGINDKKIRVPGQRPKLDPEIQAQIDRQQAEIKRLADLEERRQMESKNAQERQQYEGHVGQAKSFIESNLEDYPLLSASHWAAADIIRNCYQSKSADMRPIADQLEKTLAANVSSMFKGDKSDKSIRALLKADPELQERLVAALDLKRPEADEPVVDAKAKPSKNEPADKDKQKAKPVSKTATETATPVSIAKLKSQGHKDQAKAAMSMKLESFLKENRPGGTRH